ncbi:MAG: DUF4332 domain-containing protein [Candidatus Thermoplasmatota archaeon]
MTTTKKAAKPSTSTKAAHPVKPAATPKAKPAKVATAKGHVAILGIEGIGPKFEAKLVKAGIKSSADLAALSDVKAIAEKTGIPDTNLRLWKAMAVLLPVKGIGPQFAEVLARTGVASLKDLANCDAKKLAARIEALVESKAVTIVGTTVTPARVKAWIAHAKDLTAPEEVKPAKPAKKDKAGTVTARVDAADPTPKSQRKFSTVAAEIQAATSNALPKPMKVRQEHPEIKDNQAGSLKWAEEAFVAFFGDEIEAMVNTEATIHGDRSYIWRCECCDAPLRVPRRTTVFHGDFEIVHDDSEGLLVNGVRHVPGAYTKGLEVVQPGRLRNPWTNKLIEGKDLGTTGVQAR